MDNLIHGLLWVGGVLGAVLTIKEFVIPTFHAINNFFLTVNDFFRDWSGEPARPGRDAVPGVMERLNQIDGTLKNNGGSSLRDAVDRIEAHVKGIDSRLKEGDEEFERINHELDEIRHIVERRHSEMPISFRDRRRSN